MGTKSQYHLCNLWLSTELTAKEEKNDYEYQIVHASNDGILFLCSCFCRWAFISYEREINNDYIELRMEQHRSNSHLIVYVTVTMKIPIEFSSSNIYEKNIHRTRTVHARAL